MKHLYWYFIIAIFIVCSCINAKEDSRLLRFPAIHKNNIVFTYSGNLYLVPSKGGIARKITNDPGDEIFPKFSQILPVPHND